MITPPIKTHIINLSHRSDRWQSMIKEIAKTSTLDCEFIKAIYGKDLGDNWNRHLNTPNKHACLLSHIKAIQKAIDNDYDNILILEDDLIICDNFDKKFTNFLKQTPKDWDILYLGYTPTDFSPKTTPINNSIIKLHGNLGAWAYLLPNRMFSIVLNEFKREHHYTDNILAELQQRYNTYCSCPFLAYVKDGFSDTSEMNTSFPEIQKHI